MDKQVQLDSIAQRILSDKICPLLAATATQLVAGDGNPDAEIVFIGEAPGKNEDAQGKPFVGAAGKLLNNLLEEIGFAREDVFITNIVKYRPPDNRDPSPSEIAAFMPYLTQQLDVIEPRLVVPLGRHAMNVFLPELRISAVHGQPKRIRLKDAAGSKQQAAENLKLVILPLYHPAVALYNGNMRAVLAADFAKIPGILTMVKNN